MFRDSVKSTGHPLHSPVSPSLPLPASPCAITFRPNSTTNCAHFVTYIFSRSPQLVGNPSQFRYRATPLVTLPEYTLPLRLRSKLYKKVHQCLSQLGETCISSRSVVNISKNHVLLPCASKPKISTNKEDVLATKGSIHENKQLFGSRQCKQKNSDILWHKTKPFSTEYHFRAHCKSRLNTGDNVVFRNSNSVLFRHCNIKGHDQPRGLVVRVSDY